MSSTAPPPAPPSDNKPPPRKSRARRWGDAAPKKSRFSDGPPPAAPLPAPAPVPVPGTGMQDKKAKALAMQASIAARLAALKKSGSSTAVSRKRDASTIAPSTVASVPPAAKKAKVFEIDMSVTKPANHKPPPIKKARNPYLAHADQPDPDDSDADNPDEFGADEDYVVMDERLQGGHVAKPRLRHKPISFVEPGKYVELAEKKRAKAANAVKSGFVSGRKEGQYVKATGMVHASLMMYGPDGDYETETTAASPSSELYESSDPMSLPPRPDAPYPHLSLPPALQTDMPHAMEWWDAELLPTKLKKILATKEGEALARKTKLRMSLNHTHQKHANEDGKAIDPKSTNNEEQEQLLQQQQQQEETERQALVERCFQAASLDHVKTAKLVQHPVPVHGPRDPQASANSSTHEQQPTLTLHLTKKEMKRQRKLRRAEKLRDIQDLQAAGLIPAPEPRLTLSNFMKVLGDQAVMDPSQMEAKVNQQIQARRLKHEKMNEERKLTKEQKKDKRARKLAETDTQALSVALFLVKDMSHRYHRTKVDLNAQQNSITGGVLECENPELALVIAEGGPKAMKRYIRLMTVRMKWKGENSGDNDIASDDDEPPETTMNTNNDMETNEETAAAVAAAPQKFNAHNSCELVWTGMAVKRMFHSFVFQSCASSEMARKVLEAKGVAHYWDQVLAHAKGQGESFQLFRLG
eukprot:scaffold155711_cov47-Attheya_sp.AAC.1